MPHVICGVEPGSPAERAGVLAGDVLVAIDGRPVIDLIDYQALTSEKKLSLTVERGGERRTFAIRKGEYRPLGLAFQNQLMSCVRRCANQCVFCFVDQLPAGARPSMRIKDDDWRLSLMMGNYVTLTNVSERELGRIIERRVSPLYISVHATDPGLRAHLLGSPRHADILPRLRRLADAGLSFHTQAVLCPGLNDGAALERTIRDLAALRPHCLSLALVPVGLTGHRGGLYPLRPFDRQGAGAVIDAAEGWQRELAREGGRFVYPSDELYLAAGRPLPPDEAYDGYPQLENGVGLLRLLQVEFDQAWAEADPLQAEPAKLLIATGASAAPFLRRLLVEHPLPGVSVEVRAIENRYFGPTVTVAGLLTAGDLIEQLRGGKADRLLLSACMLRDGGNVFLDDLTLEDVEGALGIKVTPVGQAGEDLLRALMGA
ncbi:MAG: DUF512 domain-containing protein [Clostridiales bacterium]|nr:DUF512 domain-containing protein [Clostridiales bacterium]